MISPKTTIQELQKLIAIKQTSAQEVIAYYHARLAKHAATLNCAVELFSPTTPTTSGPLFGIPGLIKDNICQQGYGASAASNMLKNFTAPYESTVSARLKAAGAVSLGRANMDEFAMGGSGEYSAYGPTKNPWNLHHSPGGSSAGSAAAVGAGLVPWALGTETGGSVRQPASFCGLTGLYPTYGRFSRYGLIAFCSSFDQPGPLTKTVYDNALIASHMSGVDEHDSSTLQRGPEDFTKNMTGKLPEGIRIGVLRDSLESEGVDETIKTSFKQAVADLEKMGATISYISLPNLKYGIAVYFVLSRAEAASNLSRFDGTLYGARQDRELLKDMYVTTRHDAFGKEIQRRILMGNFVLSSGYFDAYYGKAQQVRNMIRAEYEQAFTDVDVIISPTASTLPFTLGEAERDPLALYMADYFTVPNCITGLPALSIPCGYAPNGLPIGFQFMGPALSESLLYQVAYAFEQNHDYHTQYPAAFME
ncbi:MAG: aspartyl-tRNA(Asn)/glutamyl-tRNA(Gln) amidotransferase subunit [Candidatus Dependentiae bacterium]|nr:aspartyl-tRNA(Asn)/glutamyl-tRNA(Gln) amidotransferase subunit [Candidatus Dependentiae bacterium]